MSIPETFAHPRGALPAGDSVLVGLGRQVHAERLDGDLAARRAVRGDEFEKPVLCVGRQVGQQSFGEPGGRLCGVEPRIGERRGPVVAKVDCDRDAMGPRVGAVSVQSGGLVLQHLGLIDLEHRGACGPVQPVGAGVEACREDDHLPDARAHRGVEVVVEVMGAHGLVVA